MDSIWRFPARTPVHLSRKRIWKYSVELDRLTGDVLFLGSRDTEEVGCFNHRALHSTWDRWWVMRVRGEGADACFHGHKFLVLDTTKVWCIRLARARMNTTRSFTQPKEKCSIILLFDVSSPERMKLRSTSSRRVFPKCMWYLKLDA